MMFPERVMESLKTICMAVGAVVIVLLLLGVGYAFAAQEEYVLMSRQTFELMLKAMNACGMRI